MPSKLAPENLEGNVWKYGDHINTDVIIPAKYLNEIEPRQLASHCMESIDKDFVHNVQQGDIMVAHENFGCGSSREHAPIAIKASGISCIIAASFARIFFRNAINVGLPVIVQPDAARAAQQGDRMRVNLTDGMVHNLTQNKTYQAKPLPPFVRQIINSGGFIPYITAKTRS